MKYITYIEKGGRSGHKLKDIFSLYILSFFIKDLVVAPHHTWKFSNKQAIINFDKIIENQGFSHYEINKHFCKNFHQEDIFEYSTCSFTETLNIDTINHRYGGIKFESLQKIINKINSLKSGSLVKIYGVFRIHPFQLSDWYDQGLIKEDIFLKKFIPLIRKFYYNTRKKERKHQLSIHIRRGDIAPGGKAYASWGMDQMYWPLDYFCEQIDLFKQKHPNVPIKVFSEKHNSKDLLNLKKYSNLELNLGGFDELEEHICEMVSSSFFMPCNSGLSSWISYISEGRIIMPNKNFSSSESNHKEFSIKQFHEKHIWA